MSPYPRATWATGAWWPQANDRAINRKDFVAAWFAAAAPPKPGKQEFVGELKAWPRKLAAETGWLKTEYDPVVVVLTSADEPNAETAGWEHVSTLFTDCVDPLARFSAGFVADINRERPRGLPAKLSNSVKCYALKVAPVVRAAMAAPAAGDGSGGLVASKAAVLALAADPESHRPAYHAIALRRYIEELVAKRVAFLGNPAALAAFDTRLAELGVTDIPVADVEARKSAELRATRLLETQVRADRKLLQNDDLAEAYLRAHDLLSRWIVEGRDVDDARILYAKLRAARIDGQRGAVRRGEVSVEPESLNEIGDVGRPAPAEPPRWTATAIAALTRYHPDCWEKRCALELLSGPAILDQTDGAIRGRVLAAWEQGRPEDAVTATAGAAIRLVEALLFLVVTPALPAGALTESPDAEPLARKRTRAAHLLRRYRIVPGESEPPR